MLGWLGYFAQRSDWLPLHILGIAWLLIGVSGEIAVTGVIVTLRIAHWRARSKARADLGRG